MFEVRVGHPAEQIVMKAEETSIELIVTGHRGKGTFVYVEVRPAVRLAEYRLRVTAVRK